MKQLIRIVSLQACCFVVCVLLFHPVAAQAQQSNVLQSGGAAAPGTETRTTLHADLVTRLNPDGIMLSVGGYRRWEGKGQVGSALGINPAYGQLSIHGEWTPAEFAVLRLQYDLYRFFGTNGALLSFGNAGERFGEDEIEALEGKEESGFGHRLILQPTLQAKAGPVIVRNRTDLAYYLFDGSGPFFYEWEYDTLLKDGDLLVANQTHLLYEAWKGRNGALLLAGPYYEITHAAEAELTRQRAGGEVFWVPAASLWSLDRPRVYSRGEPGRSQSAWRAIPALRLWVRLGSEIGCQFGALGYSPSPSWQWEGSSRLCQHVVVINLLDEEIYECPVCR